MPVPACLKIMKKYLTNTFTPAMCRGLHYAGSPLTLDEARDAATDATSAVGHEVTAKVLTALLGREVAFNRVNLALQPGDVVVAVIPDFRASEAREFTFEEVSAAGWTASLIEVSA